MRQSLSTRVLTTTGLQNATGLYQGKTKAKRLPTSKFNIEVLDEKSQPILEEHFELLLVAVSRLPQLSGREC